MCWPGLNNFICGNFTPLSCGISVCYIINKILQKKRKYNHNLVLGVGFLNHCTCTGFCFHKGKKSWPHRDLNSWAVLEECPQKHTHQLSRQQVNSRGTKWAYKQTNSRYSLTSLSHWESSLLSFLSGRVPDEALNSYLTVYFLSCTSTDLDCDIKTWHLTQSTTEFVGQLLSNDLQQLIEPCQNTSCAPMGQFYTNWFQHEYFSHMTYFVNWLSNININAVSHLKEHLQIHV